MCDLINEMAPLRAMNCHHLLQGEPLVVSTGLRTRTPMAKLLSSSGLTVIGGKSASSALIMAGVLVFAVGGVAPAIACTTSGQNPPTGTISNSYAASSPISQDNTSAQAGCNGAGASPFGSGHNGYDGQSAGGNGLELSGGTVQANGAALEMTNQGGTGGNGSGDSSLGVNTHAGSGGTGGTGGSISLDIDQGVSLQGTGQVVEVRATGGTGGIGATGYNNGSGGTGGSGGLVTSSIAGAISQNSGSGAAVQLLSQGGAGGYQNGNGRPADNNGTSGGTGGSANQVSLTLEGTVQSAGDGLLLQSIGGSGGTGGQVTAGGGATGIAGGRGGNSGSITLQMPGSVTASGTAITMSAGGGTGGDGTYAGAGAKAVGGNGGQGGTGGGSQNAPVGGTVSGSISAGGVGIKLAASGGDGGTGGSAKGVTYTKSGDGGAGGSGGLIGLQLTGQINAAGTGVSAASNGGKGGTSQISGSIAGFGGQGGTGGSGGSAAVAVNGGSITSNATGLLVDSRGGDGGQGGQAQGVGTNAGRGGSGGAGGTASGTVGQGGSIKTTGTSDPTSTTVSLPGLWVHSNGGVGGAGGSSQAAIGTAGGGGFGGAGGTVTATVDGQIDTSGAFAHGVLAQSTGGAGGNGNDGFGLFYSGAGSGLTGGAGGAATLGGTGGTITTTGVGASGMIGQSVGGGGGVGGNALAASNAATVAIGGNGGLGGDGSTVTADIGNTIITRGDDAAAVITQSIGGAGGIGGNATAVNVGVLSLAIGGDGKGGGAGQKVSVSNSGLIATTGLQSTGISAQSIGGGGGHGGSGLAFSAGVITASVAIGGKGGTGANGGEVDVSNSMQITTLGSDSYGIKAQSIGGGGGDGGTATSTAVALSPDPEIPSIAMGVSVGGNGAAGGTTGTVSVQNDGLISTAGGGAMAMVAQSIAGGGGNGGDSSAWSYSTGGDVNISGDVSIGGTGGSGGTGNSVTMNNAAMVVTTGESAHGMLGQSIGGGGGAGGKGDASAGAGEGESLSIGGQITVGGSGGTASQGGLVTMSNNAQGGIVTQGDGANAMLGQSIGGGGGAAGGGVGKANGGTLAIGVTVGGNGGSGGNGGEVDLANHWALRTTGADADAMVAQSIGGGGGKGGKGSSTNGGAEEGKEAAEDLVKRLGTSFGLGQSTQQIAVDVIKVGDGALKQFTGQGDLAKVANSGESDDLTSGTDDDDGDATSISLNVGIGGTGGAGGTGGQASAYNEGWIVTEGARSDGIFVQSVGGGGGAGGAASASDSDKNQVQLNVGGAGNGGGGGDGGAATITHAAEAITQTYGVASNALVAQSIGGGGGKGGVAASKSGGLKSVTLGLGGSGGVSGNGKAVTVNNDVSSIIQTTGKNAVGIVAQSIGGGGGIAHVLSKDQTGDQSGGGASSTTPDDYALTFSFGGKAGSAGAGGTVLVQSQVQSSSYPLGGISTQGRNAYGILAQSIGGGGGLAAGGQVSNSNLFGYNGSTGAGGDGGSVTVDYQGVLKTAGDGAMGIWAQSIGGGGGIAGDTAQSSAPLSFSGQSGQSGKGGPVSISLSNAAMSTGGKNAHVIFAQSIGGGGGQVTTSNGAYTGKAGGTGAGGTIGINVGTDGSTNTLTATSAGSSVIKAQSAGQTASAVTVNIGANSVLTGANGAAALDIEGASGSTVTNAGYIHGEGGGVITASGGAVNLINQGGGWLYGDISLNGGTYTNNGEMQSRALIDAAEVLNNRDMGIGLSNQVPQVLSITGNLTSPGYIYPDVDFVKGTGDIVQVAGNATISGTMYVQPITLAKGVSVPVLNAGSTLNTAGMTTTGTGASVYTYSSTVTGNQIHVDVDGDFTAERHQLGASRVGAASHLQSIWDSNSQSMGREFALIARSADSSSDYREALDQLSGRALGTIGASRHLAGQRFMSAMNSCPELESDSLITRERTCGWFRVTGGGADHDGDGDHGGFRDQSVMFQAGGQVLTDNGWILGGSLGYEDSSLDAHGGAGSADGKTTFAGVVIKREIGNWTVSGALAGGRGSFDTTRRISLGGESWSATGSSDTSLIGVQGRIAYQMPMQNAYLKAYVDVDAVRLRTDGFTERGADNFNLRVDGESDTRFSISPMIEVGGRVDLGRGIEARPYLGVGAVIYDENSWTTTARFVNAPDDVGSFPVTTELPDAVGQIRGGVQFKVSDKLDAVVEYQGQFASGFDNQTGALRLNWRF